MYAMQAWLLHVNVVRRRRQQLLQSCTCRYCAAIVAQVLAESLHQTAVVNQFPSALI